jgi:4-amino-4-deoxy-L-arabinose transferase-like glycosyltransferase
MLASSNGLSLGRNQRQVGIGLALAFVTLVIIVATLPDAGITWDEPLYIKASRGYMTWLGLLKRAVLQRDLGEALSDATIVRWWVQDPTLELHPPLGKFLSALTWATLRGVLGDISAHRFSNAVLFSVLVAMVFWMVASAYDTASGIFAALSLVLMPRMFFHAHLANIDTTVAITWFAAMYLFWKYESRPGWLPVVIIGVAYALALGTKMNAILMPVVWAVWVLLFRRSWRSLLRLGMITVLGVGVFVAIWPWLYHDTANRLLYYVLMASRFKDRPQFYLGQTLSRVPWHYPFVITLAVVPLVTTVMYLLGIFKAVRRPRPVPMERSETDWDEMGMGKPSYATGWLLLLNALIPLLFAATGLQAAYSGERHFIPAYPYLACLAGVGFGSVLNMVSTAWHRFYERVDLGKARLIAGFVLALLLMPPLLSIVRIHPYQLSYYSELVGGLPGATRLGLETTFWCETYKHTLTYLDEHAEPGASVWAENPFVLRFYQHYGMLREDLEVTGGDIVSPYMADYAVVEMRQTGFHYTPEIVSVMRELKPVHALAYQGVALLHVYKLR